MKRILATLLLAAVGVHAQQAVVPAEGRHMGKAGETVVGEFLITNVLTEEVTVTGEISNAGLTAGTHPLPEGKWISFITPLPTTLAPGRSIPLKYSVQFPPNFTKESAGTLTLSVQPTAHPDAPGAIRRGIPIYLIPLPKNVTLGMTVAMPAIRFAPRDATVNGPMSLEASLFVTNSGNAQILPKGTVTLKSGYQTLETLTFAGTGQPLLPGSSAPYSGLTNRTDWPSGTYQAVVRLTYGEAYGKPQTFEKTYTFEVSGTMISVRP